MSKLLSRLGQSRLTFPILCVIAWVAAVYVTIKDAVPPLRASYAILNQETYWKPAQSPEEGLDRQRQIQTHYLSYGVYIPLDDIVIGAHVSQTQPLTRVIQGVCGPGSTAVWVPVAFHFPIFGEKVFEWCLVRT